MRQIVFLGATAIPEIAELISDINAIESRYEIIGALDDDASLHGTKIEGVTIGGGLGKAAEYPQADFVFSIGSFRSRLRRAEILRNLALADDRFATLIHPRAKIYSSASVGAGSIIHCGAVIANGARLGRWSIVLWNVVIGADNLLGDGAMVASGVVTNSKARIGSFSFIGAGSQIAEDVTVGPGAMIAMGSLVMRDVPPGAFQLGNPPRILSTDPVPPEIIDGWQAFALKA